MPEQLLLATRRFSMEDSRRFADFCGDANPMHVDAILARRMPAGEPLIHGIQMLLWALDVALERHDTFVRLQARFRSPVVVGDYVELRKSQLDGDSWQLRLSVSGIVCVRIDLDIQSSKATTTEPRLSLTAPNFDRFDKPAEHTLETMRTCCGRISTSPLHTGAGILFPNLSSRVHERRVAALARLSTLVGMVCPGLNSVFASLDIHIDDSTGNIVEFAVTDVNEHVRRITQEIAGSGIHGRVIAFARVPPVEQLSMAAIAKFVQPDEFTGSVALVAGGSRGLGALTAKIIAAGGGDVIITYALGLNDAVAVQADIRECGGSCDLFQFDALDSNVSNFAAKLPAVTHFYYFASPTIFARLSTEVFVSEKFNRFVAFYVIGFQRLCCAIRKAPDSKLRVLYPSTSALDERPAEMTEYCMAKAAGEVLCDDLMKFTPDFSILRPRLPRIPTDQTTSIVPQRTASAVDTMLPLIRALHAIPGS